MNLRPDPTVLSPNQTPAQIEEGDWVAWDWQASLYDSYEVDHTDGIHMWYKVPGSNIRHKVLISLVVPMNLRIVSKAAAKQEKDRDGAW